MLNKYTKKDSKNLSRFNNNSKIKKKKKIQRNVYKTKIHFQLQTNKLEHISATIN